MLFIFSESPAVPLAVYFIMSPYSIRVGAEYLRTALGRFCIFGSFCSSYRALTGRSGRVEPVVKIDYLGPFFKSFRVFRAFLRIPSRLYVYAGAKGLAK